LAKVLTTFVRKLKKEFSHSHPQGGTYCEYCKYHPPAFANERVTGQKEKVIEEQHIFSRASAKRHHG
jgi:hypothetical protein